MYFGCLNKSDYICNYNKFVYTMIKFHDVKTTDRELVQSYTLCSDRQNCDLSFANIIRFIQTTKVHCFFVVKTTTKFGIMTLFVYLCRG